LVIYQEQSSVFQYSHFAAPPKRRWHSDGAGPSHSASSNTPDIHNGLSSHQRHSKHRVNVQYWRIAGRSLA